jgi:mono/diheme cytochrome c family protein
MKILFFICLFMLAACEQSPAEKQAHKSAVSEKVTVQSTVISRWYAHSHLHMGEAIYQVNCLSCHKQNAVGTKEWKKTLANGDYPPPPLNGTAHAWHHDMGTLMRSIKNGGIPLGGVMPGFSNKLTDHEVRSVIAYIQSFWSDEIYQAWLENGGLE